MVGLKESLISFLIWDILCVGAVLMIIVTLGSIATAMSVPDEISYWRTDKPAVTGTYLVTVEYKPFTELSKNQPVCIMTNKCVRTIEQRYYSKGWGWSLSDSVVVAWLPVRGPYNK